MAGIIVQKQISEKWFEYRHLVTFHETNLVGNVYFANYFSWQGMCREILIAQNYSEIIQEIKNGFGFATEYAHNDFFNEAFLFDAILIKMTISDLSRSRIEFLFDFILEEKNILLARGRQAVVWINSQHRPSLMPEKLYRSTLEFFELSETLSI